MFARATSRTCTKSRCWRPSSKTRGGSPRERAAKDAGDARVRRVVRHSGTVDIVIAQRCCANLVVLARECAAEMFLVELGRGVDVAGVDGGGLGHGDRRERRAAHGARWLEVALFQCADRAFARAHGAVFRARIRAFAVHDHAAREDEPAREPRVVQRAQQHRRPEVVVRDVLGDVAEVDAEADHGGLMADGIDAADGLGDERGIARRRLCGTPRCGSAIREPRRAPQGATRRPRAHPNRRRPTRRRRASRRTRRRPSRVPAPMPAVPGAGGAS